MAHQKLKFALILSLIFFGYYPILLAQNQEYIVSVRHFNMIQGLSNNDVFAIHKDSRGLMWMGTRNGLNRFDGQSFTQYHDLNFSSVHQIEEDEEGYLWLIEGFEVITDRVKSISFVNIYDKKTSSFQERFGAIPFDDTSVIVVRKSPDGQFFLGLKNGEIYTFHPSNGFTKITDQLRGLNILNIVIHSNGHFWVHTKDYTEQDFKWTLFDNDGAISTDYPVTRNTKWHKIGINNSGEIQYLVHFADKNDRVYVFKADGELHIYPLSHISPQLPDTAGISWHDWMKFDPSNQYLLSNCLDQLQFFDKEEEKLIFNLSNDKIPQPLLARMPFFDDQNTIWIPSSNGIYLVHWQKNPFTQFLADQNFPPSCRGIWSVDDSTLIANTYEGTFLLNTKHPELHSEIKALKKISEPLLKDHNGDFWFGKDDLIRWNKSTNETTIFTLPSFFLSYNLRSLIELDDGKIGFCGSRIIGLLNPLNKEIQVDYSPINTDGNPWFKDYHSDFINHQSLYGIVKDKEKNLWCLTTNGLFSFDFDLGMKNKYGKDQTDENYLPASVFRDLYQDREGIYWLATGDGGLIKWDMKTGEYQQFSTKNGLTSNAFYALFGDDFGNIWLSSDNGIIQFNKTTHQSISYLPQNGVTSHEFNRGSSFQANDGTIYFGSTKGITAFHPKDFINEQKQSPDVRLSISDVEKLEYNSERFINQTANFLKNKSITIHPKDQFLNIKLLLDDYFNQPLIKYVFRINGYEKKWNEEQNNNIRIGRLPYGNYVLDVKAKLANGQFSKNELHIPITVVRPFYFSWWFVLLSVAALVFATFLVFKWRTKLLYQRKNELEVLVEERTKIILQQTKKLEDLDRFKTQFFANISHELRTPLSLVLGSIDLVLKSAKLNHRNFSLLSKAKQNSHSILRLIRELLDITKLETNELKADLQPVLLHSALNKIFNSFEPQALHQGIDYQFHYKTTSVLNLLLDQKKLESIIQNLLSNALKFTHKNGQISFIVEEKPSTILLSIKDTGRGIQEKDLPFIFDRFYQAKNNSEQGGTGLGLAICKEYTQLMGGEISIKSDAKGNCFYVELPKVKATTISPVIEQPSSTPHLSSQLTNPSKINRKNTILIVEDNSQMVDYLSLLLENQFNIITAANGTEALLKLQANTGTNSTSAFTSTKLPKLNTYTTPDLILSDIMMPVMDGFQLLATIKEDPNFNHIPIIMLTAKGDETDKLKALRIGVDDYLLKPFNETELMARIVNLINNFEARKAYIKSLLLENRSSTIGNNKSTDHQEWLKQLEAITKQHLSNFNISVDVLAQEMNMGRTSFFNKIKKLTGLSPKLYLQEIRLMQARFLLENGTEKAVKSVSYAVGMKDVKYFSQLFKKRFGRLPSEYL